MSWSMWDLCHSQSGIGILTVPTGEHASSVKCSTSLGSGNWWVMICTPSMPNTKQSSLVV